MVRGFFRVGLAVVLMLGALSASAATVSLTGTTGNSCTYVSATADASGSIVVTCSGGGGNSTAPSTQVKFYITPSATSTVTGTAVAVRVTRLVAAGGTPGSDTVTVALDAGTTSPTPTPSSLVTSFLAADGHASSKLAGSVTFAAAGTAALRLTGAPTAATPAPVPVTVVAPSTTVCPAFSVKADIGTLTSGWTSTGTYSASPAVSDKAVLAFKFTVPATSPAASYVFIFPEVQNAATSGKDVAISTCPGDFSANGMSDTGACFVYNTNPSAGITATVSGVAKCPVSAGSSYYLNVRARDVGRAMGFTLGIQ